MGDFACRSFSNGPVTKKQKVGSLYNAGKDKLFYCPLVKAYRGLQKGILQMLILYLLITIQIVASIPFGIALINGVAKG